MLMDTLGVVIGFAAVMLLLSLIVTTGVQLFQSLFRMRARNLVTGLRAFLKKLPNGPTDVENVIANLTGKPEIKSKIFPQWLSPAVSWVEESQLLDELKDHMQIAGEEHTKKIVAAYNRMEAYLSKRFGFISRIWSVALALAVAFLFQVSALDLARDLSTNAALRDRYVAEAEGLLKEAETMIASAESYENVSEQALNLLQENHPDLAAQIEEASGTGGTRNDIVRELDVILAEDAPDTRSEIIEEYEKILDSLYGESADAAVKNARAATAHLATFNVTPWPHGWNYYGSFDHILGVLLTMVLLSFGAPFWFRVLKEAVGLRDALAGKKDQKAGSSGSGQQGATTTAATTP